MMATGWESDTSSTLPSLPASLVSVLRKKSLAAGTTEKLSWIYSSYHLQCTSKLLWIMKISEILDNSPLLHTEDIDIIINI